MRSDTYQDFGHTLVDTFNEAQDFCLITKEGTSPLKSSKSFQQTPGFFSEKINANTYHELGIQMSMSMLQHNHIFALSMEAHRNLMAAERMATLSDLEEIIKSNKAHFKGVEVAPKDEVLMVEGAAGDNVRAFLKWATKFLNKSRFFGQQVHIREMLTKGESVVGVLQGLDNRADLNSTSVVIKAITQEGKLIIQIESGQELMVKPDYVNVKARSSMPLGETPGGSNVRMKLR